MPDKNDNVNQLRVVWLFNCIGASGSLMYWGGILPKYLIRFPQSWFFTARPPALDIPDTDRTVECVGSIKLPLGRRRDSYERQLVIGSPRIVGVAKELKPDVVVIQEFLSFAAYFAFFRWRLRGAKFLLLLESDPVRGIRARNRFWIRNIRKLLARRIDSFLTNNEAGRSYLVDQLNIDPRRVMVRPYLVSEFGAASDASLPADLALDAEEAKIFLYVGQLVQRKGVEQLIRAVAKLSETDRRQLKVWLVGDGEQRQELESLASELKVADSFRFAGRLPYEQLGVLYESADAFIMPTLDDYRALVGFEAISYGLPILHSKYDGAVGEVVEDGLNGFQIDPRDASDFAGRISRLLNNDERREEMGRQSKLRSAKFTVDSAVEGICEAIEFCKNGNSD